VEFSLTRLDYVAYVLILQALPLFALLAHPEERIRLAWHIVGAQALLLCVFFLAWGGYSMDAWRYMHGFAGTPFAFKREWGFWILGHLLTTVAVEPWPIKLLGFLSTAIAVAAVIRYLKRYDGLHVMVGLFVLACTPVFIFTFGNALRQGMGMSIMLAAVVLLTEGRRNWFITLSIVGALFHISAIVLAASALLSMLPRRLAVLALTIAPVIGLAAPGLMMSLGVDLGGWIPYSDRSEGSLYIAKFLVVYPFAWALVLFGERGNDGSPNLDLTLVYAASFSFLLLGYEVPFERLLLYSLILPCVIVPVYVLKIRLSQAAMTGMWAAGVSVSAGLWMHQSTAKALGFSW